VAEALDKLAVPKEVERELADLRQEVERLKRELDKNRGARRAATPKGRPRKRKK
jgi:uncharacterized small protein (DUF1192 family)